MPQTSILVSICILTNAGLPEKAAREKYLKRLLASIELAGFPVGRFEVIVAGAVPSGLGGIRIVSLPEHAARGRVCAIRNALVEAASGAYVIHCDDDILFTKSYWPAVSAALGDSDILCTRLLNPDGSRYWDWAAFLPDKGQTLLPYSVNDPHVYATGGHGIYRREIFKTVRWDESISHGGNEEFQLAADARKARLKYSFCEQAVVFLQYHHCSAEAVIRGQPQPNTEIACKEFAEALASLKESDRGLVKDLVRHEEMPSAASGPGPADLRARLGHKLVPANSTQDASPFDVSVLTCCNRYLQRFRVFAQSLCRQDYDLSRIEVVVTNPHSPDGLSGYLRTLKMAHSRPHFVEALVDTIHWRNRGHMIQEAFRRSRGRIVIGMDCDLVLPPDFIRRIVETVRSNPKRIIGVYRNFLRPQTTASILAGGLDPFSHFEMLKREDQEEVQGYRGVLGYCQATTRDAWQQVGYPVEYDEIAKSDVAFVERLAGIGVTPLFIRDLVALHLNHERNWMGTDGFL